MIIGVLIFELYFPYSHSLKEKRKVVSMVKDKVRTKYNVSVAEVDFLDLWQRTKIAISTISCDKKHIDRIFKKIHLLIEESTGLELLNIEKVYG